MVFENPRDAARGGVSLPGGVPDAGQEEFQPGLPVALGPDPVQEVIVSRPAPLEAEAQIQDRFPKRAGRAQKECDEQAAVAVQERVNRLELDASQAQSRVAG